MIYLLDANSFIQAKNLHYRMRVVPGFWDWLVKPHDGVILESIDHVYAELTKHTGSPDELHGWAQSHKHFFRASNDLTTQQVYARIANHVALQQAYSQAEIKRFLRGADPWLIATAKNLSATIVTHEVVVPANSSKIKIPNVAREFEVQCTDIFDLLELTSAQLVLGP
ncbi:DUF4411 family protein [Aliidiomarina maris]|uniref:DUF4411 domain-containing protein n=1 Tax=Aliidiomarina maris TaxID=531312 RepID=A0A327WLX3_9GAMM|nr:DUF4411 family protein [Aliidiomarina maris]RAJ92939.1 uncharacterized protein DUF4411 [Aliidiomarina maris]RUO18333.1 DUF4411 domain-containing protein [Aliidiomarina maris]